jgi:hypothetical protein
MNRGQRLQLKFNYNSRRIIVVAGYTGDQSRA